MTEQDQAGPQPVADGPDRERFREVELPGVDLGDTDAVAANIAKATARLRSRRQEKRTRALNAEVEVERRRAVAANRHNALRTVDVDGVKLNFTACACKWHGLRVSDPEVALREYDAHPCTIPLELEDDHPAYRDLRMGADGKLVKRPASMLAPNLVQSDGTIINTITRPLGVEEEAPAETTTKAHALEDDFEVRAALLELK